MALGTDWALAWIREAAQVVSDNRAARIKLDREIGDGGHAENMDRGFSAVIKKLDDAAPASIADVLKLVATTLMSTVGGAAGPLYGTAFLRASKAAGQAESQNGALDAAAAAAAPEAGPGGGAGRAT